jgi:hypothetical protein
MGQLRLGREDRFWRILLQNRHTDGGTAGAFF